MSDDTMPVVTARRKTIADAEKRQQAETEVGVEVAFYDGEEAQENYLGSVWVNNDPKAYTNKLNNLKAKKGKPKSYVWGDTELQPLREEAEIGTFWTKIEGWVEDDGVTPIESTPANIKRIMSLNFVNKKCTNILIDEGTWEALAKEELAKN